MYITTLLFPVVRSLGASPFRVLVGLRISWRVIFSLFLLVCLFLLFLVSAFPCFCCFFLSRLKRNDGVVIAPEAVHSRNGTKGPKTFWKPQRDRKEGKKGEAIVCCLE
jgi:hypothetical protein